MFCKEEAVSHKQAIIIGAGPAGLTAAYELITRTNIKPIIIEATSDIGGIAKTVNYKGNRMDIGGHRFFSKSRRVTDWWANIFPLATSEEMIKQSDNVMLLRNRVSRIFFLRKFFNYPVTFSFTTLKNLGFWRVLKIGVGYLQIRLFPIKNEKSLEDFFINRFGKELYRTFFKDYTEKVWGIGCEQIKPEWGAQRIKGLSITKTLIHAAKKIFTSNKPNNNVETSLIEQFNYPKFGPGSLWEEVARIIIERGGEIHFNAKVKAINTEEDKISSVELTTKQGEQVISGDYYFSTMPIKDLILGCNNQVPQEVTSVAQGLVYRDFITVGLLLNKLKITSGNRKVIPDNWIYIQEKEVKLGRIQVFNNWSPYLVSDQEKIWLGLEYFCNEDDELWSKTDKEILDFATDELAKIDIIDKNDMLDGVVIRMPKTYPAYFGTYDNFPIIKNYLNQFENLFLIGRNGMHRYNNMDHSMLTAMVAVDNIVAGITSKANIWAVNTEEEYHESN